MREHACIVRVYIIYNALKSDNIFLVILFNRPTSPPVCIDLRHHQSAYVDPSVKHILMSWKIKVFFLFSQYDLPVLVCVNLTVVVRVHCGSAAGSRLETTRTECHTSFRLVFSLSLSLYFPFSVCSFSHFCKVNSQPYKMCSQTWSTRPASTSKTWDLLYFAFPLSVCQEK